MENLSKFVLMVGLVSFSACTRPGETTGVGAAAGGVLGAGMGAIVGSQTGDAGGGLVVGALAGSVAGAAVGNALEAHEDILERQDEAIERQQRIISSQQSEIQELRRIGQDTISFKDRKPMPSPDFSRGAISRRSEASESSLMETKPSRGSGLWKEKTISGGSSNIDGSGLNTVVKVPKTSVVPMSNSVASNNVSPSGDCAKADAEVSKAKFQDDISDKLFHYRRALRLCPNNAAYHNSLGELYLSLNRKDDAKFEFSEAVRLNPGFKEAKDNFSKISK